MGKAEKPKAKCRPKVMKKSGDVPQSLETALSDTTKVDVDNINVVLRTNREETPEEETIAWPWRYWHGSGLYHAQGSQQSIEQAAIVGIRMLHQEVDLRGLPLDILCVGQRGIRVVATRDIQRGELTIPPSVSRQMT